AWYPRKQVACPLCEMCLDSHEHLFFEWPYSAKIGNELKHKVDLGEITNEWDDVLTRIIIMACNNSVISILRRIVVAANVCTVGLELDSLKGNVVKEFCTLPNDAFLQKPLCAGRHIAVDSRAESREPRTSQGRERAKSTAKVMVIDKSWALLERHENAFYTGLMKFVDDCKPLVNSAGNIKCPCKSCRTVLWVFDKC
ncbi:hypothetical protein Tco_1452003, partial [Tanacetum coccineum]